MYTRILVAALAALLVCTTTAWAGPDDEIIVAPAPPPDATLAPACGDCKAPVGECYTCNCSKKKDAKCPPKYANLRFDENWKPCMCLSKCDRGDWTDMLKAVPLTRNKSIWANFGGQVRARYEFWQNQAFGAPADATDNWLLMRIRAHADVHFGTWGRVFVEGIFADIYERELGPRPIDRNTGDFLNAFVELGSPTISGWVGRHDLSLGAQRLISPLDWANTRRVFQGAGGQWSRGFHKVQGFAVRPVIIDPFALDDEWNEDQELYGLHYANTVIDCITWEAYALGLHRDESRYGGVTGQEDRLTLGMRAAGKIPGTRFDYDCEGAFQTGTFEDADILAGMVSLSFGWKPITGQLNPYLGVGFDWASGDDDPTDSTVGTFNQLFPLGHKYFGMVDALGRQNLTAARIEGSIQPMDKLTFKAIYQGFWRSNENDGAYGVGGGLSRPGTSADSNDLGSELDLYAIYKPDRHWRLTLGWGHFFTGDFYSDTGASKDIDLAYFEAQYTF